MQLLVLVAFSASSIIFEEDQERLFNLHRLADLHPRHLFSQNSASFFFVKSSSPHFAHMYIVLTLPRRSDVCAALVEKTNNDIVYHTPT